MLKIDIHTHIIPKTLPNWKEKFGYGGFIHLDHHANCRARMLKDDGTFFRDIEDNSWDADTRVKECNALGINIQVLSTVPVMLSYWAKPQDGLDVSRFLNDHLCEVVRSHPNRFAGLGTVPLQDPELACRELERCMTELKFVGVQIGSHVNDWNLDDPALFPFYETAQKVGAAIFVHPWDMMASDKMKKYLLPWLVGMPAETSLAICSMLFGGIFEKFPKLRVCFAHGGGAFPGTLGRIERGFQSRPDICAVENKISPLSSMGKFFVDSLVHDEKALKFILDVFGEERVMLGSDYPFPLGEARPGFMIESLGFEMMTRKRLFNKNALSWMNRKESDFA